VDVLVRKIEARARPARVLIFDGPGVSVDPSTMALYAKRWEGSLGVSIRVAASEGGDPAAELLRAAEGIDVAVVNPGAADLVDVLPPEILTAFVGFSYPGTPAVRFDRGPIEDIAGRTLDGYRWALKYPSRAASGRSRSTGTGQNATRSPSFGCPRAPARIRWSC
jgi:hypothetical protein